MNRQVQREMREHRQPGGTGDAESMLAEEPRVCRRSGRDGKQRMRPVVEKHLAPRRLDSGRCQDDPDEVGNERSDDERSRRRLRNATLDRQSRREMGGRHGRGSGPRKALSTASAGISQTIIANWMKAARNVIGFLWSELLLESSDSAANCAMSHGDIAMSLGSTRGLSEPPESRWS
jgi:hypothetical protein